MGMDHKPAKHRGAMLQGGMPKQSMPREGRYTASGLLVRGVVTATYVTDSGEALPVATQPGGDQVAIYCDVLVYSGLPGAKQAMLPRCLVTQERGGLQEGDIWCPRATRKHIEGDLNNAFTAIDAAKLDGDHVLVGFLDDELHLPVILRGVPHPSADAGHETGEVNGHRMKLRTVDGNPRLWKHLGAFWGMQKDGNHIVDLTRSHNGETDPEGKEPEPACDGSVGNYVIKIPENSKCTIELTKGPQAADGSSSPAESTTLVVENNKVTVKNAGGAGFVSENKDDAAILHVGDAAIKMAIADHLKTMWEAFMQTTLASWNAAGGAGSNFITLVGPAFQTGALQPEPWDPAIESSKVKAPDG